MANCDYSEWKNGAALIVKEWQRERSDFNHLDQRPHNGAKQTSYLHTLTNPTQAS